MSTSPAFAVFDHFPSASLADLEAVAGLQTRFDRKFIAPASVLAALAQRLDAGTRVLEIDGRREFAYDTWYVDTPDLQTYRDHVKGRRRRFKLRARTYVERSQSMLEIKFKGPRGRTVKRRVVHPDLDPRQVSADVERFFDGVLQEEYGVACPPGLRPSARTWYVRTTLIDPELGERVTVDRGLEVESGDRRVRFDPGVVLIEAKSPTIRSGTLGVLRSLGLQPAAVSKYGVAVTTLFDQPGGNRWFPALRQLAPQPELSA